MPIINCLEISAVARLILQGASTCLADLRDLLHTQHLASAGSGVSPAVLRKTPCKPSGAKRLRAQCEVRQVPHGQSCLCSSRNKPRLRSAPISHHTRPGISLSPRCLMVHYLATSCFFACLTSPASGQPAFPKPHPLPGAPPQLNAAVAQPCFAQPIAMLSHWLGLRG